MLDNLERHLAQDVAAYMAATDETARQNAARRLCATLEVVSDARLKAEDSWSPHAWVDGVLDDSITVLEGRTLFIRGKMIWVDNRNEWWLEPFEATVTLSQQTDRPTYELRIGDADRGMRSTPYGSFQRREFAVKEWIFRLQSA